MNPELLMPLAPKRRRRANDPASMQAAATAMAAVAAAATAAVAAHGGAAAVDAATAAAAAMAAGLPGSHPLQQHLHVMSGSRGRSSHQTPADEVPPFVYEATADVDFDQLRWAGQRPSGRVGRPASLARLSACVSVIFGDDSRQRLLGARGAAGAYSNAYGNGAYNQPNSLRSTPSQQPPAAAAALASSYNGGFDAGGTVTGVPAAPLGYMHQGAPGMGAAPDAMASAPDPSAMHATSYEMYMQSHEGMMAAMMQQHAAWAQSMQGPQAQAMQQAAAAAAVGMPMPAAAAAQHMAGFPNLHGLAGHPGMHGGLGDGGMVPAYPSMHHDPTAMHSLAASSGAELMAAPDYIKS